MAVKEIAYLPAADLEGLEHQLTTWQQRFPRMGVVAFLPERELSRLPDIQRRFQSKAVPLVGAVFPALIIAGEFQPEGLLLFCFEQMPRYLLQENLSLEGDELAEVSRTLASQITEQLNGEGTTLFMLFDAMLPNVGHILEELYLSLADRVHYMGGNAGSEQFQAMSCLFDNHRVIQNGLLAVLLPNHRGATLEHGYVVPERLVAATSTEGNRIISIDWRPAFEVYAERVKAQYSVEITAENFYQYGVHFPFGIIRADSEVLVRIPVALMEDGSLFCVGEIPPNAVLTLLESPQRESLHTAELLTAHFDKTEDTNTLSFYCAGRRLHLGLEAAQGELRTVAAQLGDKHLYGALSLGEIGSSRRGGYPLFHNAALVLSEI